MTSPFALVISRKRRITHHLFRQSADVQRQ
jgi:hypothetical protein